MGGGVEYKPRGGWGMAGLGGVGGSLSLSELKKPKIPFFR